MNKMIIRTNTITGENYDEYGNFFSRGNPRISVNSTFRLEWYLYTDTPGANEDGVDVASWIPDVTLEGYSAILTCDSDWIHRVAGALATESIAAGNTFPEEIAVTIASATSKNIAPSGKFTIYNSQGLFQTVLYTSRTIQADGKTVLLTIGSGVAADYNYASGDSVTVSQEVYFEVSNDAELSDPANGKFVFDVVVRSRKLQAIADTTNSGTIAIKGIELMPFTTGEDGEYIQAPAYLLDTAVLISTIGDPVADAEIGDPVKSEIAQIAGNIVRGKLAVEVGELTSEGSIAISGTVNPPVWLQTSAGNLYPIEKGSLRITETEFLLDPTPYLAYDNVAEFSGTWKIWLSAEISAVDLTDGLTISTAETTAIPIQNHAVVKRLIVEGDAFTFDVSGLSAGYCANMELWLEMRDSVKTFSFPADLTWIDNSVPAFDTADKVYAIVLRWDGSRLLANLAYSVEVV